MPGRAGAPEWMSLLAGMGHSIFLTWSWTRGLLFCTSTYLPVNCSECAPASHLWKQLLFLGTLKLLCTLWHCRASPCYRSHSCTEGLPE